MQAPEPGVRAFLHVGCGSKRKDRTVKPFADASWREVTLDIDERVGPDIVDSLPDMAKAPSGAFDAVYSAHNIEHLYPHQVPQALAAFRRVLKDDGFAVITCPDLQSVGERLASGDVDTPLYTSPAGPVAPLDVLYGFRPSVARGNLYMAHHGGFTLKSLSNACQQAGFLRTVGFRRPQSYDLWVLASKTAMSDAAIRDLGTTYLVPA
jgi:SAM-dependent methyltransferase